MTDTSPTYAAFKGSKRIASGALPAVADAAHAAQSAEGGAILVFDNQTGKVVDLDLRGCEADVKRRYGHSDSPAEIKVEAKGRGRPRLGVVAREVTLLPEHWVWLNAQPGGASVMLRKLVHKAKRQAELADVPKKYRDRAYNFMSALAGDLPAFEEASRALFAGDIDLLRTYAARWPSDIGDQLLYLLHENR